MLMSKNVNNDVSKDSPIQCEPGFRKTMDSSEDEGLFVTQSSTKGDISAEIEGNV